MANILDTVTLGAIKLIDVDANPAISGGTAALIGDIASDPAGTIYINRDGTPTNWRRIQQTSGSTALTAGSVLFIDSSGDTTESNSIFFWDNVNGRLGIGTNAPVSRFHQHNTGFAANRFTNATTGATSADGCLIGIDAAGNGVWTQFENLPILFSTNNTLALTIAASGILIGANAIRPGDATDTTVGNIRYNATSNDLEGYVNGSWLTLTEFRGTGAKIGYTIDAVSTATNSTSTTPVTVSGMTRTPTAGTWEVDFTCAITSTAGGANQTLGIYVAGVLVATSQRVYSTTHAGDVMTVVLKDVVTVNGSQVVDIRWQTSAGNIATIARAMILKRLNP